MLGRVLMRRCCPLDRRQKRHRDVFYLVAIVNIIKKYGEHMTLAETGGIEMVVVTAWLTSS
jgi:hypothetical protein